MSWIIKRVLLAGLLGMGWSITGSWLRADPCQECNGQTLQCNFGPEYDHRQCYEFQKGCGDVGWCGS